MDFKNVLFHIESFFKSNGFSDTEYYNKKNVFLNVLKNLNVLILKGLKPGELNEILCAQEISVWEENPKHRCLQQLHFFVKFLKFEKAIWARTFNFINFPLNATLKRVDKWTEPKKSKILKQQHISAYADSLLFSLKERDHVILSKLSSINAINEAEKKYNVLLRQLHHVTKYIHKEEFVAKHYHFIRPLRSKLYLKHLITNLFPEITEQANDQNIQ